MSTLMDRARSIERGVEVIADWLGEGGITVDRAEAQRRANICLGCPQNRSGSRMVAAVAEAIKKHIEVKNTLGLRVQGEKSLGECGVCLCSLPLKIWVPQSVLRKHMLEGEPEAFRKAKVDCWQVDNL